MLTIVCALCAHHAKSRSKNGVYFVFGFACLYAIHPLSHHSNRLVHKVHRTTTRYNVRFCRSIGLIYLIYCDELTPSSLFWTNIVFINAKRRKPDNSTHTLVSQPAYTNCFLTFMSHERSSYIKSTSKRLFQKTCDVQVAVLKHGIRAKLFSWMR